MVFLKKNAYIIILNHICLRILKINSKTVYYNRNDNVILQVYYAFVLGISLSLSLKKSRFKSQVLDYLEYKLSLFRVSSNFPLKELCKKSQCCIIDTDNGFDQ